jgi:hypothetical protein
MAYACNPSTWESEAGGSQVGGKPRLHSKTFSQKKKKKSCSFLQSYPTLKIIKHISTKTDTSYSKYDD